MQSDEFGGAEPEYSVENMIEEETTTKEFQFPESTYVDKAGEQIRNASGRSLESALLLKNMGEKHDQARIQELQEMLQNVLTSLPDEHLHENETATREPPPEESSEEHETENESKSLNTTKIHPEDENIVSPDQLLDIPWDHLRPKIPNLEMSGEDNEDASRPAQPLNIRDNAFTNGTAAPVEPPEINNTTPSEVRNASGETIQNVLLSEDMNPKFDQARIQELHKILQSVLSELGPADQALVKDVPMVGQLPTEESSEENELDKPNPDDENNVGPEQMLNNLFGDKLRPDIPSFNEGSEDAKNLKENLASLGSLIGNGSEQGFRDEVKDSPGIPDTTKYANNSMDLKGMFLLDSLI